MENPYVITISHLLGCGGARVGASLSEKLSIPFVDSQILKKVSDKLGIPKEDIEHREEKKLSFWETFFRGEAMATPLLIPGKEFIPLMVSDDEMYALETRYIEEAAQDKSCILLGRGANYILRNHPRHLRIFVYASPEARVGRIAELYHVNASEAQKIMSKNDKDREAYLKTFTKRDMLNLQYYDLCVDTSSLGMETAVEIAMAALGAKLGVPCAR